MRSALEVIMSAAPPPNRSVAECFLRALAPDTDRFTFQTFTDSRELRKRYEAERKPDLLARVLHGTLAEHWDKLVDLPRFRGGLRAWIRVSCLTAFCPPVWWHSYMGPRVKAWTAGAGLRPFLPSVTP
jgi:hypothetical protein